jgi:hypothetical protein
MADCGEAGGAGQGPIPGGNGLPRRFVEARAPVVLFSDLETGKAVNGA